MYGSYCRSWRLLFTDRKLADVTELGKQTESGGGVHRAEAAETVTVVKAAAGELRLFFLPV